MMASLSIAAVATAQAEGYLEDFKALHRELGKNSATIGLHQVDWKGVGREFLPKAEAVDSDEAFGKLSIRLLARLNDSHAGLMNGSCTVPPSGLPVWDAGFACLTDAEGRAVVYYVAKGGPADRKGVRPGMAVVEIDGEGIEEALQRARSEINGCIGYSTARYLDYHTVRWFARRQKQGEKIRLVLEDPRGRRKKTEVRASEKAGYIPRLPVPLDNISDGGSNIQWTKLKNNIGYIYVRRIQGDLGESLDRAVEELKRTDGIIIDVRGNSGGGFDFKTAHYNFNPESPEEEGREKYDKPLAVLISPRCISAGEGWASWFAASERARFFGEPTAGASGRKTTYTLPSGRYKVRYVVKPYKGYLDRYIEGRGLEPDVMVIQTAEDLAEERDTVLEAARTHLLAL
jgi:C-terminal processing protease CtpA/Prc